MMEFAIDHIGYVTKNIEKSAESFTILGYSAEEVVNDDTQKTKICFLRKKGEVSIELVEPYPENATMLNMLKKGTTPYHTCYTVPDVQSTFEQLKELGFTPLFNPVPAPAFGHRLICYFWKKQTGLIEIVEQEKGE